MRVGSFASRTRAYSNPSLRVFVCASFSPCEYVSHWTMHWWPSSIGVPERGDGPPSSRS